MNLSIQHGFASLRRHPFVVLSGEVALLLISFVAIERIIFYFARLPPSAYGEAHLTLAVLRHADPLFGAALMLAFLGWMRYGGAPRRWTTIVGGAPIRACVVLICALLAWSLSTYGHNYFYDQAYAIDRVLLLALAALVAWRPGFVFPFLLLSVAMHWQIMQPSLGSGSYLNHTLQLVHVVALFGASLLIYPLLERRYADRFWLFVCCLVAAVYWEPGISKVGIGWLDYAGLHFMPLAAYAHGWRSALAPEAIVEFANLLTAFDTPMRIFVLAIELGCIAFLAHRLWSIALLGLVMVFHLGVFVLYGYLFWTWIALDAILISVLIADLRVARIAIYSRGHLLLSMLLIGTAGYWCQPSSLAWFDSPLSYTFRYFGVGDSGVEYEVPPRFFAPYGDAFTMANFSYLINEHKVLVSPYGIANRARIGGLLAARDAADIFRLENELGANRYDAARAEQYYDFLTRYLEHYNRRQRHFDAQRYAPPPQFWNHPRGRVYTGQEALRELQVVAYTTFFDGQTLSVIRRSPLRTLQLSRAP